MALGIIPQKNGVYALRLVGGCGEFTAGELVAAAKIAERFGRGCVTATSRGTLEVNGVTEAELQEAVAAVEESGLRLGGTGTTVRAVTTCKGTECRRGMFDVHGLAMELDRAFYGREVPKKFKIGVFGCSNSLGKAMAQDVGVMPSFVQPGRFELYVGGLLGNKPAQGRHFAAPLTRREVIDAVGYILELYCREGRYPQRLRAVLNASPGLWQEIELYLRRVTEEETGNDNI